MSETRARTATRRSRRRPSALFVVEHPWWPLDEKPSQESVLPYVEGLSKRVDCESYYSSFFDLAGLRHALTHLQEAARNHVGAPAYLYVAGHGGGRRFGSGETRSINLASLVQEIRRFADAVDAYGVTLEGVVIGSCQLGRNDIDLLVSLYDSPLHWIAGYGHSTDWFEGTQIDLSILHAALGGEIPVNKGHERLSEGFRDCLSLFNPDHVLDREDYRRIRDTLVVVGKPAGQGFRPRLLDLWPADE